MSEQVAIGIDLGGTNIKAAVVDREARLASKATRPCQPERGPDMVISEIAAMVRDLIREAGVAREQIVGVGLGTPGPLDLVKGEIVHAANLPGWRDVPIRAVVQSALGLPVILENDANAAAFGEYWAGAGRDRGDLVMLTLGTGVGGGVVLDGRLLHGHFGNAGELGHMIVVPDGLPCGCGQRGCLEQYASANAVVRRALSAIKAGELSALRADGASGPALTSHGVAEAAAAGDPLCRRIWRETCMHLAIACVNLQHAFDPATIVLGGGLAEAGELLLVPVREEFGRQKWSLCEDAPSIAPATLGRDAGVVGAAGLAWLGPAVR